MGDWNGVVIGCAYCDRQKVTVCTFVCVYFGALKIEWNINQNGILLTTRRIELSDRFTPIVGRRQNSLLLLPIYLQCLVFVFLFLSFSLSHAMKHKLGQSFDNPYATIVAAARDQHYQLLLVDSMIFTVHEIVQLFFSVVFPLSFSICERSSEKISDTDSFCLADVSRKCAFHESASFSHHVKQLLIQDLYHLERTLAGDGVN